MPDINNTASVYTDIALTNSVLYRQFEADLATFFEHFRVIIHSSSNMKLIWRAKPMASKQARKAVSVIATITKPVDDEIQIDRFNRTHFNELLVAVFFAR